MSAKSQMREKKFGSRCEDITVYERVAERYRVSNKLYSCWSFVSIPFEGQNSKKIKSIEKVASLWIFIYKQ